MTSSDAWGVVVLGSGIAGLAGALAAHELGLRPIVLEKASTLGGGTVNSYGLIWVGQNHLAQAAGYSDTRDETIAYMRFLGGGRLDDDRMSTFVDRSPEALKFFEKCGIRFHVVRGVTDHYYGKSPGSHAIGRSVEVDLISGFDLGDWRNRVSTPDDVPCFVTAEEQITWGGINSFSRWDQDLVRERKRQDMRGDRRAAFLRRRAASGWWLVCRLAGRRSGTGHPPAASSHSGPLRLRQCRRRHRAWCRLPSRLVARLVDDVQLPRRSAHDRRPITCSPSAVRGTVIELFREV